MTNDELVVLLPQIKELIDAYEKGVRKKLSRSNAEEAANLALSLHISPMHSMRFAMNAMDAASITPAEMEVEYKSQVLAQEKKEVKETTEEQVNAFTKKWLGFEQDCEIVGGDEWYDTGKVVEEDMKLGGLDIPKRAGYKVTNPVKVKMKVDPLWFLDAESLDISQKSKKKITECFDCELKYNAEVMYPSIEVMWEFEKLLKGLSDAIKLIKKNMDPADLYLNICNIKAFVGKNFLCPSMMTKINLMLPTLFMKYSMDLGKISIDANFVLGGVIKVAVSFIAAFLENIRALIVPFLDCYINAAQSVSGYVRSVARAISQGIDEVGSLLDKTAQVLHKGAILVGEIFSKDPMGVYENDRRVAKELAVIKEQHKKASEELKAIMENLKSYSGQESTQSEIISEIQNNLTAMDMLLTSLPEEYGGEYPRDAKFKDNPLIQSVNEYYIGRYSKTEEDFYNLTGEQFQVMLIEFFSVFFKIGDFRFANSSLLQERIAKGEEEVSSLDSYLESKQEELKRTKQETFEKNKDTLAYKMQNRDKKVFDYDQMGRMGEVSEDKVITSKWLERRYSFNLANSYVDHEYLITKKIKSGTKRFSSDVVASIADFIDDNIIRYLVIFKKHVNDFFGNIINALRNLNLMLEQNTFSQFTILGEILQLTHIIRAYSLIEKLIDEGFEGCDKLSKNKAQEKILKDIIEEVSEDRMSAEVISKEDPELKSEEQYLKIYARKGDKSYLTRLKDCSEATKYLEKTNPNLDLIYDSMKEGLNEF